MQSQPPLSPADRTNNAQRRKRQSSKNGPLKDRCPKCGRTEGWFYFDRRKKQKTRIRRDFNHNEYVEQIIHAQTDSSGESQLYHAVRNKGIFIGAIAEIWPLLINRYPYLRAKDYEYANAIGIMTEIWQSWSDERHRKDLLSWWKIAGDVKKHGYNAAASLNPTVMNDDTEVKISTKQIRKRMEYAKRTKEDFDRYAPVYIELMKELQSILENDSVAQEAFGQAFQKIRNANNEYDSHAGHEVETETELQNKDESVNESFDYNYIYILHHDPKLYKKQKDDFKSGKNRSPPTGRVKCGPFTQSELTSLLG